MKRKTKAFLTFVTTFITCTALFVTAAYLYLNRLTDFESEVTAPNSSIPYEKSKCENTCLLLTFPDGSATSLYLDFNSPSVSAAVYEEYTPQRESVLGFAPDFTLGFSSEALCGIIDRIGGIELTLNGSEQRYTGIQIDELAATAKITPELYREILKTVFKKFSAVGITSEDLVYLIENTSTNLTVPDCYYWQESLPQLFANTFIVN